MRLEERINQDVLKFSESEMSVSKSSLCRSPSLVYIQALIGGMGDA
jgi:hypothetical protein